MTNGSNVTQTQRTENLFGGRKYLPDPAPPPGEHLGLGFFAGIKNSFLLPPPQTETPHALK